MKKILLPGARRGCSLTRYSGFLGSAGQIGTVLSLIEDQPGALVLVDPVMGDCGEIYKTYTPEMCELMHRLCARADIITPNLTEACLLAGVPYDPEPDDAAVDALLGRLDGVCRKGRAHHRRHRRAPRRRNRRRLLGHAGGRRADRLPVCALLQRLFSQAAGTFWPPSCSPACCPGNARPALGQAVGIHLPRFAQDAAARHADARGCGV